MKPGLLLFFVFVCTVSYTQSPGLRLFENSNAGLITYRSDPKLIGKVGENYLMMDYSVTGIVLTVFDSSFEFVNQREQLPVFYNANKWIARDSLHLTWSEFHTDEEWLCSQSFDQNGNSSPIRTVKVNNQDRRLMYFVTNKDNNRFLFYTLKKIDSPNIVMTGVILDAGWQKIKEVSGSLALSTSLERAPLPMMDAEGNIQVFVYDKLSNYRLSANLTVNTLPFKENSFRKETFQFTKIKLYNPFFSDDPETRHWIMNDFFYDGQTKEKKGIVTLKIPYERGKELEPVFMDLPDSVQKELRKHTKSLRARQPVSESLLTTGVLENNGSVIFITDLLDLPSHQLVRDVEVEPELRTRNRSKYRNAGPGFASSFDTRSKTQSSPASSAGTNLSAGPMGGPSSGRSSFFSKDNVVNEFLIPANEKRVVFFVDAKGDLVWHQYLSEENPSLSFSRESPVSYLMKNKDDRQFLHYHPVSFAMGAPKKADTSRYIIQFSLTHISPAGISWSKTEVVCPAGTRFFKPLRLSDGRYLMPYINGPFGKSGLALLQMENSN